MANQSIPLIGIIANPYSASDVRRIVSNAGGLSTAERANIVTRVLATLSTVGISRVIMMPDRAGISTMVERARRVADREWPTLEFVDMQVQSTVEDTLCATQAMHAMGVAAIIVLGGDGTHRAVASRCGDCPIASLSTGTNNAFADFREPTVTALATGLLATGRVSGELGIREDKVLVVDINDGDRQEIALVDVAISAEKYVGSRALWETSSLRELFVAFAEPDVIGLSSIAGLIAPSRRSSNQGRHLVLGSGQDCSFSVNAPIAPGRIETVGVKSWGNLELNVPQAPVCQRGLIMLDGEREFAFTAADKVRIRLQTSLAGSIDVDAIMQDAAIRELFVTRRLS